MSDAGARYFGLNQDRLVCEKTGDTFMWCVLDGHCPLGEHAAEHAANAMRKVRAVRISPCGLINKLS